LSRPRPEPYVTYAEYLAQEDATDERLEYHDGQVYLMTGGTPEHSAIYAKVIAILDRQLQKCRVFTADLRVRVVATGLATHPDVSTERYDRNEKFAHYRQIPSLAAYVLISPLDRRIEVYSRGDQGAWILHETTSGAARLPALDATLPIDEVYLNPL